MHSLLLATAALRAPAVVPAPRLRLAPAVMQLEADRVGTDGYRGSVAPTNMGGNNVQQVQGGSLRTWSYDSPDFEQLQVVLGSEGGPLDATVELWQGPDNVPCKMRIYGEDGEVRPFRVMLETASGPNTVAVRNIGQLEFPLTANVVTDAPIIPSPEASAAALPISGGSLQIFAVAPEVDRVQVLLDTDGRPLDARIELLQGPNNNKQVIELYSEDGMNWPFFCILETPGTNNAVRVVNTGSVEFPMSAAVVPHSFNGMRSGRSMRRGGMLGRGGGWGGSYGYSDYYGPYSSNGRGWGGYGGSFGGSYGGAFAPGGRYGDYYSSGGRGFAYGTGPMGWGGSYGSGGGYGYGYGGRYGGRYGDYYGRSYGGSYGTGRLGFGGSYGPGDRFGDYYGPYSRGYGASYRPYGRGDYYGSYYGRGRGFADPYGPYASPERRYGNVGRATTSAPYSRSRYSDPYSSRGYYDPYMPRGYGYYDPFPYSRGGMRQDAQSAELVAKRAKEEAEFARRQADAAADAASAIEAEEKTRIEEAQKLEREAADARERARASAQAADEDMSKARQAEAAAQRLGGPGYYGEVRPTRGMRRGASPFDATPTWYQQ